MNTGDLTIFLKDHLSKAEPLAREVNIAYWNATLSGKKKDFDQYADYQVQLQRLHSAKEAFDKLKFWNTDQTITNPIDKRQIKLLYNDFLRNQIDPKLNERITKLATNTENQFNVFRGKLDGKMVSSNEILQILRGSNDSTYRKKAWEAGKKVGALVHDDLIVLVKLRNEAARSLGYKNFFEMSLALSEQDENEITTIFNEVEELTRIPFAMAKKTIDEFIAAGFGISTKDIRPWHYEDPFFQEAPRINKVNLDKYYESLDILELVREFYEGISFEVKDILEKSDLYEKPGKLQHAYCTDIDRKGDIRILANIKNNENWTGTMLHELGHAVYMKYIDSSLPYLLREEAHTLTTEAVSILLGMLSKDAEWIQAMIGIPDSEKQKITGDLEKNARLSQLIFSRWCQVMFHFERGLYSDPDGDLNGLWWDLIHKYQQLEPLENRDEPDWASKIHIVSAPVYYHNYMLGELLATQLDHYVRTHVIPSSSGRTPYYKQPELGRYFKEKIFSLGARYKWDQMIELATGEKLTPRYFVDQFVE